MPVIVSTATRSLVVPRNEKTTSLFPNAKLLDVGDEQRLVVPHGLREFLLLRRLGYKVPNPMLSYYGWSGGKPFSVQKATCAMMTSNPRSYVLNDMGTGKTKAALWAWDYLRGNGLCGKLLVVAPLSTLNFVWAREVFATLPNQKAVVLHGSKAARLERLNDPAATIFIINHDGLRTIQKELEARTDIDCLVLDELAVYRNNSDRSKSMRKFATRFPWVWGMTGRPMPNEPTDVWAQCMIVTPTTVPKFQSHARDMLMVKISPYVWKPKNNAVQTAFKMLTPSARFSLDDVVELPELITRWIDVPLSAEQTNVYTKMAKEFQALVADKVITAANAGAAMSKLLQVASGFVYTKNPEFVRLDSAPREQELLDILSSVEGKVLLFAPYRHVLEGLAKLMHGPDEMPAIDYAVVHGGTSAGERDRIFNLFQNTSKHVVLLAHPACLAHGITLTAARTSIWYGPVPSLEIYEQANARFRRVGQKHKQQLLHFQSTPVEKRVYALLHGKQRAQDMLLALLAEATKNVC
jgi:SNF2 family DNA or RNA helicase